MLLFVYGTLLSHHPNHHLLKGSPLVTRAYVKGTLYDIDHGFPALVTHEEQGRVYGEVYDVPDTLTKSIDSYEGYTPNNEDESLYLRREILCFPHKSKPLTALTYIMPEKQLNRFTAATLIPSGRWQ